MIIYKKENVNNNYNEEDYLLFNTYCFSGIV